MAVGDFNGFGVGGLVLCFVMFYVFVSLVWFMMITMITLGEGNEE